MNNDIIKDVEHDLKEYGKILSREAAQMAKKRLTQATENAITAFYEDYEPKYYKRHTPSQFYTKSFRPYYSSPHGTVSHGGVELTPQLLDNYYQARTAEVVFSTVYSGLHGPVVRTNGGEYDAKQHIMSPSPFELIFQEKDYIIEHQDELIEPFYDIAKSKGKYRVLFK